MEDAVEVHLFSGRREGEIDRGSYKVPTEDLSSIYLDKVA